MHKFARFIGTAGLSAAIVLCGVAAQAQTIGNALISRNDQDTATGGLFVMTDQSFSTGTVATWGFYDVNRPANTFQITPVIFHLVGGNYTITGVGTTRTDTSAGAQNYAFGLTSGSASVALGYYFGWRDGNASGSTTNQGVPQFTDGGTGSANYYGNVNPTVNSTPTLQAGNLPRTYSIQASLASPEPTSVVLAASGMLGVLGCIRRRRRSV